MFWWRCAVDQSTRLNAARSHGGSYLIVQHGWKRIMVERYDYKINSEWTRSDFALPPIDVDVNCLAYLMHLVNVLLIDQLTIYLSKVLIQIYKIRLHQVVSMPMVITHDDTKASTMGCRNKKWHAKNGNTTIGNATQFALIFFSDVTKGGFTSSPAIVSCV